MFIAIEGIDGSGKATQARLLAAAFDKKFLVYSYSFPRYETPAGMVIKELLKQDIFNPLILQSLMLADKAAAGFEISRRIMNYESVETDIMIIADRWTASGICYGNADEVPYEYTENAQALLPAPDLNIFIDTPPEICLQRRPSLRDAYERNRQKQKVVYGNYRDLWLYKHAGHPSWVSVNGCLESEKIHAEIVALVKDRLIDIKLKRS